MEKLQWNELNSFWNSYTNTREFTLRNKPQTNRFYFYLSAKANANAKKNHFNLIMKYIAFEITPF